MTNEEFKARMLGQPIPIAPRQLTDAEKERRKVTGWCVSVFLVLATIGGLANSNDPKTTDSAPPVSTPVAVAEKPVAKMELGPLLDDFGDPVEDRRTLHFINASASKLIRMLDAVGVRCRTLTPEEPDAPDRICEGHTRDGIEVSVSDNDRHFVRLQFYTEAKDMKTVRRGGELLGNIIFLMAQTMEFGDKVKPLAKEIVEKVNSSLEVESSCDLDDRDIRGFESFTGKITDEDGKFLMVVDLKR